MTDDLKGWSIPLSAMKTLAPKANPALLSMFSENLIVWAPSFGLNTRSEVREFIAQCLHESSSLTTLQENLNYSANRLMQVWPNRFPSMSVAAKYGRNPAMIANKVYANRMGNGDEQSGDGWRFRGRGLLQATGKDMYQRVSTALKEDFVSAPDKLSSPEWALPGALAVAKLLRLGECHGIVADTLRLNGGKNGLADRTALLNKVTKLIP